MTEQYFKNDSKSIVDILFDNKMFREDVTRDLLNGTEDYLAYAMQSKFDSHQKAKDLFDRASKIQSEKRNS